MAGSSRRRTDAGGSDRPEPRTAELTARRTAEPGRSGRQRRLSEQAAGSPGARRRLTGEPAADRDEAAATQTRGRAAGRPARSCSANRCACERQLGRGHLPGHAVAAMVIGGLLIAFSRHEQVLHAWGYFFSGRPAPPPPGLERRLRAYVALFEGAIFNPHTVARRACPRRHRSGRRSSTRCRRPACDATPLIARRAVGRRWPSGPGMFNIGAQGQLIGGAICATYARLRRQPAAGACTWSSALIGGFARRRGARLDRRRSSRRGPARTRSSPRSCSTTSCSTCSSYLLGTTAPAAARADRPRSARASTATRSCRTCSAADAAAQRRASSLAPGRGRRRVVAAVPQHARVPVPGGGRQPERGPGRRA